MYRATPIRCSMPAALAALAALAAFCLSGCASTPEPDPMQVKIDDMDTRLGRVEGVVNNQSLVGLSQRIDALETQLRQLRGSVEELQNGSDAVRKQQRDLYADLDRRLTALEATVRAGAAAGAGAELRGSNGATIGAGSGVEAGAGNTGPAPVAAAGDQAAYARAVDRLKSGDYAAAVAQFRDFLRQYPMSSLADNAQYWLGEAYYVTRDYDSAAAAFRTVGSQWPQSRKAPDALLKLGFTQFEQKHYGDARATLNQVAQRYPGTDAARLAADRLQKMPADAN
jgi:tol-pal system protein YbgF